MLNKDHTTNLNKSNSDHQKDSKDNNMIDIK